MRFTATVLLAAVGVAVAHKPALQPIRVDYEALLEKSDPEVNGQHNGGDVDESQVAPDSEGIKTDSSEDIQSEINMTPSVRLTKEMLWEASVPRYDDITQGTLIKTFKLEKDARKWVYKHSGAHWSINYPMPEGINPADNALGSSAALIEMAGSGSGSGAGAAAAVTAAASLPAVDVPLQGAGGAGPEGSGSGAGDDDAAAFCADCVKKLGEVNGRIDQIEGKLKAHNDAITGVTATKGEIVDVAIRRQSNDDAAAAATADLAAAAAAAAPAGGSGSAAGSAAEVASASAAPASSAAASSAAPAASSAASAGSAAGSGSDAASSAAAAAPNASFIEKLRTLRTRK